MDSNRICYLCEVYKEASDPRLKEQIKLLISRLPKNERVEEGELASRLDTCSLCENLADNNTCRACGCFIELRAAKTGTHCPHKKW